ncbi:phosphatidylglycerophosphatase A [Thiomicrospira sp. WB1]|uniref:phosphatidylglycerophosphatase A family protein n=1 Tax=Thiomicrospira sp. WB1 TaxID=1685380 RepID=UPI000749AA42|nr:phosphatidylglycerophosphatase A [Thiomicrospira sp. WB1]KUJ72953.1 phosphatidylglycerophosphatase [Thiomicrospira sp. WB1]
MSDVLPAPRDVFRRLDLWLAFGLGSGLAPKAPGTWGTLVGTLIFIPLLLVSPILALMVLLLGMAVGSWLCQRAADWAGVHDHGGIVWDEFVGVWLALMALPEQSWTWWLAAFVGFRFFDIVKPWPIRWVDRHVHGGVGIMLDDVLAAVMTVIVIWLAVAIIG